MLRTIMTEVDVKTALAAVCEKINQVCKKRPQDLQKYTPRLVAVSKLKPKELIIEAYNAGQRHFGENYVQELVEKGHDPDILEKCKEIQWHFIGRLQKNKISKVIGVPNIYMIETVESDRIATALNESWGKRNKESKLKVMVQINTSAEEEKNGCEPAEAADLVKLILNNLKNLELVGLMTIGKFGYDLSLGPNPDFQCLLKCREDVCSNLGLPLDRLELSMGMSDDFEHAIEVGSTNVRVGSSIFGARAKKQPKDKVEEVTKGVKSLDVKGEH